MIDWFEKIEIEKFDLKSDFVLILVHTSDGSSLPCGNLSDLLNRSPLPVYLRTNEAKDTWFAVDLGLWLEPTHYTLRHGRGSGPLRSWLFQASRDGTTWSILRSHVEDTALNAPGSTATWRLDQSADGTAWRYFRVSITAENAEQESCICTSGFEIHGTIVGVCDEVGKFLQSSSHCWSFFEPNQQETIDIRNNDNGEIDVILEMEEFEYFHR